MGYRQTNPPPMIIKILWWLFYIREQKERHLWSRVISLISVVGKVLCRILLDSLLTHVADDVLPKSGYCASCGRYDFRSKDSFSRSALSTYGFLPSVFFFQFEVFHTVNRVALWKVLQKVGCPEKLIVILWSFHDGIQAWVNIGAVHLNQYSWRVM